MLPARWLWWALGLLACSFAIFALPAHLEGPALLPISPGHAVAVLDAVAIIPLLAASVLLYGGLWTSRAHLLDSVRHHPERSLAIGFAGGLGLGLLMASVYSSFFGWWAVGAALLTAVLLAAAVSAARR